MSDSGGSHSGLRRRRKIGKTAETFPPIEAFLLPDDVVRHILSWLPAKHVLLCRCVCRVWRELTSTKSFIDLHFRHSFPFILKEDLNGRGLLDICWAPAQLLSKIHKLYQPGHGGRVLSQNGLIVSRGGLGGPDFIIYNPVYHDHHVVNIIAKPLRGDVYGVFFHPLHQEYCTLWRIVQSVEPLTYQYKILNLESSPKLRDIRNPPTQNPMFPRFASLSVDRYLYWMVEPSQDFSMWSENTIVNCDIMEYDIEKEEFRVIPCPTCIIVKSNTYNVNLVDIDGVVCVVEVLPHQERTEINIWTLKDDGEQLWTSSNYIISCDVYARYGVPKAVAFHDGQLVLVSDGLLFVCNLKLGTSRYFGHHEYCLTAEFLSHVTSLVSLKNCKSYIRIAEEDENNNNHIDRDHGEDIQALS